MKCEDIQKELPVEGIRSISQTIPSGEFIKTVSTIPFGVQPNEAHGFVVATVLIPQDLAENLQFIRKGFMEYQQIKLLKKPIQITYYISLSIVALLVVFCAVWFGFFMARSISLPIKELAEGTRRLADGDLVLVVREEQIVATQVDVVAPAHGGQRDGCALHVPGRADLAPLGLVGDPSPDLAQRGALQQGEVPRVVLLVALEVDRRADPDLGQVHAGELPVDVVE